MYTLNGSRIVPQRITEAREARGYSSSDLATLLGISRQAVYKYEQKISEPTFLILQKMSDILDFPVGFFYDPICYDVTKSAVFFRSLKSADSKSKKMVEVRCGWVNRVFAYLSQFLNLPEPNLPHIELLTNKGFFKNEDIEQIAMAVRCFWGLGNGPIENLVHTLEKNGILVFSSHITDDGVDACNQIIDGKPIIFYDKGKESCCRQRFNLAHELGHILLHSHYTSEEMCEKKTLEKIEKEAHHFASSFLMPQESFCKDVVSSDLKYLLVIKRKWKVSLAAIIYRCHDLGLFDDNLTLQLRKQLSYRHWIKNEPLDDNLPLEIPQIFKTAFKLLFDTPEVTIDPSNVPDNLHFSKKDLAELCSVNKNFFDSSRLLPITFI